MYVSSILILSHVILRCFKTSQVESKNLIIIDVDKFCINIELLYMCTSSN